MVSDSIYIYGATNPGTGADVDDVTYYQYDSACRKSADQLKAPDLFEGGLRNNQQELYNYDAAGNLHQYILQTWRDTFYVNYTRITYTYDTRRRTTSTLQDAWTDNSYWLPRTYTTLTYDTAGNITDEITQDSYNDSLKLANRYESKFDFNSSEKDTAATRLQWDASTKMWIPTSRTLSYYNDSGFLIKTEFQQWNTYRANWNPQIDIVFYNNSRGDADSSIETHGNDTTTVFKTYYFYDSVTSANIESDRYSYDGSQLVDETRTFYTHLATDQYSIDTVLIKTLSADTFAVSYRFANNIYYNNDHTIKESIVSYYYGDDYSGFTQRDDYTYAPCQSALPVSLLNFTGKQKNNDALLQWQTTNEVNTSYFMVQRSIDGVHFTPVGRVTASGNSSGVKSYSYTDRNIISLAVAKLYYRLVTTDKDGRVSYSKTAELDVATGKITISVSPNPVSGRLAIYSSVSLPGAVVKIWDMSGRVLYASQQSITAGDKFAIDVSAFAKGMYVVTVQSAAGKYECKIVK